MRGVSACADDVSLVFGELDLAAGALELEVLHKFNAAAEVLVVLQGLARLDVLVFELVHGLACTHVVDLNAVYLGDRIHW